VKRHLVVQMLLTDAFGSFGGIARFNRDFLEALNICPWVERVIALPRVIPVPIDELIPESVVYDRGSARGKTAFVTQTLGKILRGMAVDLVICGHLNLLPLAWLTSRLYRARLALIIHGIEAWNPSSHRLSNLLAGSIDDYIAVSRFSAERFSQWSKLPLDRAFILPNCVDLGRFKPGLRSWELVNRYQLDSSKVILTVGRMASKERYKGFDEVIEIMPRLLQRFPTLRYMIVGDGPDRARLEAKVKVLGLSENVIFTGHVDESEKVAHYNLADVYVMPSSGEGFGIVLIEAAACGIPIIGSSADGSRDALLDGRLGRLVDPASPEELIEAVTAAMSAERRRTGNELLKFFDVSQFQARVSDWMREQAALSGKMGPHSTLGMSVATSAETDRARS
jgi:phosphatidyl-myo-inositol dimannoside synthase